MPATKASTSAAPLRGWTGLALCRHYTATVAIVDGSGAQVTSFGGSGGTASNYGSAVPSTGTATGYSDGTNMQIPRVFDGDTGAGTQYVPALSCGPQAPVARRKWAPRPRRSRSRLRNTAANATAVKVDGSAVTQPVSISGNRAVNLAQVAGATVATGNGTASGAVRVALPTDGTGVVGLNAGSESRWAGRPQEHLRRGADRHDHDELHLARQRFGLVGWIDYHLRVLRHPIPTPNEGSSASNTAYIDWYLASSMNGETTFDDAASSSTDQAFTASNRKNSRYVGSVLLNGTSAVTGSFSALDAFGTLLAVIVPIAINNSGAAASSTAGDHVLQVRVRAIRIPMRRMYLILAVILAVPLWAGAEGVCLR